MLQTNATLIEIVGAGTGDDWDVPASAGAVKWTGRIPAYYREKADRVPSPAGGVDVLTRRTVWVDTTSLDGVNLDTDDLITLERRGGLLTSPARTIAASYLEDALEVATTRIDLEHG